MDSAATRRADMLGMRVVSAIVLLPVALAAVWFGPPWIVLIVAVAGLAMAWEWGRLVAAGQFGADTAIIMAVVVLAIGGAAIGRFASALAVALIGAIAAATLRRRDWIWTGVGTLWIACGCVAFVWLDAADGRLVMLWLLGVVWATDIFAYFVGKTVGGPRLAPQLSPNKTWAGFAGGLFGGAAAGIVAAVWTGWPSGRIAAISLGLSLVSQGGDLAESWAKRHFAVKDTSGLIPGHGGVLDRLDGLLAATVALGLLTFVSMLHIR